MRRLALISSLALSLAGCGGGDDQAANTAAVPPPVNLPVPTPPPALGSYSVNKCLNQIVDGTRTVANLVVPDTVELDFAKPNGFPNGRQLTDPVIDITFAFLFLDLTKHPKTVLAAIPLGPSANDVPFRSEFPYLAPAQGSPPLSPAGGTNFNFRTDPETAYVRVDRMGMPAVATAVISSSSKVPYNDDNPAADLTGKWVNEINATLTSLTDSLADDFTNMGLSICATRD